MHPFLAQRRAIWVYLTLWMGLSLVPAATLILPEGDLVGAALLLAVPMTVAFALVTLPTWYVCRATPFRLGAVPRLIVAHGVSGLLWNAVWMAGLTLAAEGLALVPAFAALPARLGGRAPALAAVGALFYVLVAALHYLLIAQERQRQADRREANLVVAAKEAELRALRAQVHPHFLYNSLNTVSALVGSDPTQARRACVLLAEYLRGTLGAAESAMVPLAREIDLARRYIDVEKLRLGERLRWEERVAPGALAAPVPSLVLQPLVENAITHGVVPVDEPGPVVLEAERRGPRLRVAIRNSLDPAPRAHPNGLGLANVRARLRAQFGHEAELSIQRTAGQFLARLDLPAGET